MWMQRKQLIILITSKNLIIDNPIMGLLNRGRQAYLFFYERNDKMIESNINTVTPLGTNTSSLAFTTDSIRTRSSTCQGWLNHTQGSANYDILEGGLYEVTTNITASSATAGTLAFGIFNNGELIPGSLMAETIAAADDLANVGTQTTIQVCCKGDANVSIRSVPAVPTPTAPETPTDTEVPIIVNANITISRLA